MTGPLPPVAADVAARAVELLPGRLRRRLDETIARARAWPVTTAGASVTVQADADTVVTLIGPVQRDEDAVCSCLLAPACLHRAAVLSLAPPADSAEEDTTVDTAADTSEVAPVPAAAEVAAAEAVWRAGCDLLATGITGAGAVAQAVLLRAAHDARAVGLHRLGSAALRVTRRLRSARADEPDFRLAQLVGDLRELLRVAYSLRTGHGDVADLRGTARREYRDVGNLRLYGLCCTTIATASGYGGAVTYLVDESGRLWQLGGVSPGGVGLAAGAPDALVSIGEARLTYRALSHGGLRVIHATASADGRLGSGRATTAVAADGGSWYEQPLAGLWEQPLADQLSRYRAALDRPVPRRPAGYEFLFLEGTVAGVSELGLGLLVDDLLWTVSAPTDHPDLPYVDNLRQLAGAVGATVRLVGRYAGPATVHGLAFAADWLESHVDLGVDRLQSADLPHRAAPAAVPAVLTPPEPELPVPLHLLTRRLERCVEGGRIAAPGRAGDIASLRAAQLHTAAELADRLDTAATQIERDHFGRIEATANERLALAWLAGAVYAEAAQR
jgi:hypothetical protein